jgi:L-methionine (R)-S-oxide reductase
MPEEIVINKSLDKREKYRELLKQIRSLVEDEDDLIANLANICAALKYSMGGFFWVGFYLRKEMDLVLGPYQGPVACTRIRIPNGVCGTAVNERRTVIVDDVDVFPGHIACSADSKSEIVVPIFKDDVVIGVLDVDSDMYSNFDMTDLEYLEDLCGIVSQLTSK